MEQEAIYVGIDVAKARVDVAVRPADDGWLVSNDDAGIRQLVSRLKTIEPAMVVMEASGGLELPLVAALAVEELPVVVVNPRQVRDFAKATGKLAKTDTLDAAVLAHFGEAVKPAVPPLRDAETQALSSLAARRHQVVSMLVSERNRLNVTATAVRPAHRSTHRMASGRTGRPRQGSATDYPPESRMEGEGRSVAQCPRRGASGVADTACLLARTGHAEPQADCRSGRCGPLQPGQRQPARTSHGMGWTSQSACCAVHGSAGGNQAQPRHRCLLSSVAGRRQAEEAGSHSLHAQAACDPQLHAQASLCVVRSGYPSCWVTIDFLARIHRSGEESP